MLSHDQLVSALPGLRRYALMLVRHPDLADELVQETALKALARAETFRGEASAATWLHRVLYHVFLDERRTHAGRLEPVELVDDDVMAAWRDDAYTVDPAQVVASAETRDELLESLARLPDAYRSAVLLHDVEGLTATDVAVAQEISLPAAKQRIRRGRAMLVTALDGAPERRVALKGVPMRCWDARELVGDYLDDELPDERRAVLETHLARCPTCPGLYSSLVGVRIALGALRDRDTVVPVQLADRIRLRSGADVTG